MNLFLDKKYFIYIFYFIPAFLILGPVLPELIILLFIFLFFLNNFTIKKIWFYADTIFISFSIFFLYIFFNTLFLYAYLDIDKLLVLKSFALLRFPLFYLSTKWLFEKLDNKQIRFFFLIFTVIISFVLFDVIFQYFTGQDLFGFKAFVPGTVTAFRLSGPFNDELIVGSYLSRFGFIYLFCLICLRFINNNLLEIIFLVGFLLILLVIGERAAFLLFLFGSLIYLIEKKNFKILFYYIILFCLIGFITLSINDKIKKRMIDYTIYQLGINIPFIKSHKFSNLEKKRFLDNPYGAHYETAYNIFKDNIIIGSGYKQFRKKCSEQRYYDLGKSLLKNDRCSTHPHNMYLEILSETGIVGIVIFLSCIFFLFKEITFKQNKNKYLLIQFLLFFFPIISTGSFFTNKNLIYLFFIISLNLIIKRYNNNSNKIT